MNADIAHLLHVLGHGYGNHGQVKRALLLQLLATSLQPDNPAVLRTLAYTFLLDKAPEKALPVLDKLYEIEGDAHPGLTLLLSRALMAAGREQEARQAFSKFIEQRKTGGPNVE